MKSGEVRMRANASSKTIGTTGMRVIAGASDAATQRNLDQPVSAVLVQGFLLAELDEREVGASAVAAGCDWRWFLSEGKALLRSPYRCPTGPTCLRSR